LKPKLESGPGGQGEKGEEMESKRKRNKCSNQFLLF